MNRFSLRLVFVQLTVCAVLTGALKAEMRSVDAIPIASEIDNGDVDTLVLPMGDTGFTDAEDRVSLTLDDVPIEDVVRMFMRIPGANFITSATNLVGNVTVNLTDVPWQPALVSILASHNLTLVEKTPGSAIYSIEPRRADAPEPLVVRTHFLSFATVNEVRTALEPVLIPDARLSLFPSRNALIVKTTAANMREVESVIGDIDSMREQVFIEAKFLELNDDAIQTLGVNWQSLENIGLSAGGLQWGYKRETTRDRDSLLGFEQGYQQMRSADASTTVDAEGNVVSGQEWRDGRQAWTQGERSWTDEYRRAAEEVRTAVFGMTDFNLILSALRQTEGVSVVSNPKIIVANEEKASIHIGQTERPFVSTVTPATDSSAPFTTYNPGDPVEFGVKLDVTPTVNTSSNISLLIEPTLTRFVRDAIAPTGQTYPIIARKRIATRFTVEDGKTVAIGGLTETEETERVRKVPLLGDIPLIGRYLFSHSRKERHQTETVIFVTVGMASPHIIRRDQGLPEDTRLTQRHMLREALRRHERQQELEQLQQAVEATLSPPEDGTEPDPEIAEIIRRTFR